MSHFDARLHVTGESRFLDDIPLPEGALHAAVVTSPCAHGTLLSIDTVEAEAMPGVRAVLMAGDIPGENQVGTIIMDEPLFATDLVHFAGEPVAVVIADTPEEAAAARDRVTVSVNPLPAMTDPRKAFAAGEVLAPPSTFCCGDIDAAWADCTVIVEGRADSGGQEHVYLETQGAVAVPMEDGRLLIRSGTQGPAYVQRVTARVLGIPMNMVEVDVARLGGAFGGKEDQATPWAVMAALGAWKTGRPVRLVLGRQEDMRITGKRHPYSSDYRLGLGPEGEMLAFEVTYYQNGGAASDLSTAILERTLFHSTGAYHIPNVKATGICCRTNLPPNTAFRGFGGPQAMFVMECAIRHGASALDMPPNTIQERNLLSRGDVFPYGMEYGGDEVRRSWRRLEELHDPACRLQAVETFNTRGGILRKGISMMPVCFGISFTNTSLNQASALVHVYTDGSVGVSTGAVEMGQGVNSKLRLVAAKVLGIDADKVRVESTNTTRVANSSPTAASSAADMNGNAVRIACENILNRLMDWVQKKMELPAGSALNVREGGVTIDGSPSGMDWEKLVKGAYLDRVSLSSQVHYATPGLWFDREKGRGVPFAYHVAGTALTEVTLDTLRGTYTVDSVLICHDGGDSIDPLIDRGQIEGGLLQGIGWMTMEDLRYHPETDALLTDSLATYKVPDIHSLPDELSIDMLECTSDNAGVFNSKAVGEPPFMYGIGTYTALTDALRSTGAGTPPGGIWSSPLTPEKVLMLLPELPGRNG